MERLAFMWDVDPDIPHGDQFQKREDLVTYRWHRKCGNIAKAIETCRRVRNNCRGDPCKWQRVKSFLPIRCSRLYLHQDPFDG